MAHVLLVDDDRELLDVLSLAMTEAGHEVDVAPDGAAGLERIAARAPAVLVTDVNMPRLDGFALCKRLRDEGRTFPIVILTSRDTEIDEALGLELGADDYVTKPFSVRELLGRVRAQLRRQELDRSPVPEETRIVSGPVTIDLARHLVTIDGRPISLTRSEFQLLRLLAGRPGEVFKRSQIMEELWQTEFEGDERACDVHISNLRQKVEEDPQRPRLILTVRGIGYKFSDS